MDMIVSGAPQELDFIVRICRDKVRRGLIRFSTPATPPADGGGDNKYVEPSDNKDVVVTDNKTTKRSSKKSE